MSKPADIIKAVQDELKESSTLSYVSDSMILLGAREAINNFPCIIIEPDSISENDETYETQNLVMSLFVIAYIQCQDKDLQIVGNTTQRGIVDVENDIKKVLGGNVSLDCSVIRIVPVESVYDKEYPIRWVTVRFEIEFRQNISTRT